MKKKNIFTTIAVISILVLLIVLSSSSLMGGEDYSVNPPTYYYNFLTNPSLETGRIDPWKVIDPLETFLSLTTYGNNKTALQVDTSTDDHFIIFQEFNKYNLVVGDRYTSYATIAPTGSCHYEVLIHTRFTDSSTAVISSGYQYIDNHQVNYITEDLTYDLPAGKTFADIDKTFWGIKITGNSFAPFPYRVLFDDLILGPGVN